MGDRIPQFAENLPRYYSVHSLLLLYSILPTTTSSPATSSSNQSMTLAWEIDSPIVGEMEKKKWREWISSWRMVELTMLWWSTQSTRRKTVRPWLDGVHDIITGGGLTLLGRVLVTCRWKTCSVKTYWLGSLRELNFTTELNATIRSTWAVGWSVSCDCSRKESERQDNSRGKPDRERVYPSIFFLFAKALSVAG